MVEIEVFDIRHFIHQAVRVCHTDSIIAWIACSFDFKKKSYYRKLIRAIALVWWKSKRLTFVILYIRLLKFVTLITLIASLLGLHTLLIILMLPRNCTLTVGYSLACMAKIKVFDLTNIILC